MGKNRLKKNKSRGDKDASKTDTSGGKHTITKADSTSSTLCNSTSCTLTSKTQQLDGTATPPTQFKKRDSVISSMWEGPSRSLESKLGPVRQYWWRIRFRGWWPCRVYRWVYGIVTAFARAYWGPHQADLFLTICLATISLFVSYIAIELMLNMFQTVAAQGTNANCSVVYVTVPGPAITVSILAVPPSTSAHDTHYFSVVGSSTQWLNGTGPPDRFSALMSGFPQTTSSSPSIVLPLNITPTPLLSAAIDSSSPLLSLTTSSFLSSTILSISPSPIPGFFNPGNQSSIPWNISTATSGKVESKTEKSTITLASVISTMPLEILKSSSWSLSWDPTGGSEANKNTITLTSSSFLSGSVLSDPGDPSLLDQTAASKLATIPIGSILRESVFTIPTALVESLSSGIPIPSSPFDELFSTSFCTTISDISSSRRTATITTTVMTTVIQTLTIPISLLSVKPIISTYSATSSMGSVSVTFSQQEFSNVYDPGRISRLSTAVSTALTSMTPNPLSTTVDSMPSISTLQLGNPSTPTISSPVDSGLSVGSSSMLLSFSSPASSPTLQASAPPSPVLVSTLLPSNAEASSAIPWGSSSLSISLLAGSSDAFTESLIPGTPVSKPVVVNLTPSSFSALNGISSYPGTSLLRTSSLTGEVSNSAGTPLGSLSVSPMGSSSFPYSPPENPGPSLQHSGSSVMSVISKSMVPPAMVASSTLAFTASSGLIGNSSLMFSRSQLSSTTMVAGPSIVFNITTPGLGVSTTTRLSPLNSLTSTSTWNSTSQLNTTGTPSSNSSVSLYYHARGLTTQVLSYGETAISFVFPLPEIVTTVSYWTGIYPAVTGLSSSSSDLGSNFLSTQAYQQASSSVTPSFVSVITRLNRLEADPLTIRENDTVSSPEIARRGDNADMALVRKRAVGYEATALAKTSNALMEPGPTSCGESGNFTLTFDDMVVDNNNNQLITSSMKKPYHHLYYSSGFTAVPDKWEPYPSISQPNVAMFLPLSGQLLANTPFAGTLLPGELGAGPRASVDAYWFNAYSAYFGCALNGIMPCTLRISGYRYDAVLKQEVLVAEQNATLPACWGYINCHLAQISFNDDFRALSGIQFNAYMSNLGTPLVHMMDDLHMGWYNNTCSAGILRIGHR